MIVGENLWFRKACPCASYPVREYADDYLGQQVSKLYADQVSDADYTVQLDSDCAFVRPTLCWPDLFRGGRPIHVYRQTGVRPAIDGWRMSVHHVLGINTDKEFMVMLPAVYPREIYSELRQFVLTRHGFQHTQMSSQPDTPNLEDYLKIRMQTTPDPWPRSATSPGMH